MNSASVLSAAGGRRYYKPVGEGAILSAVMVLSIPVQRVPSGRYSLSPVRAHGKKQNIEVSGEIEIP